ncbi:hypothetical protein BD626DRAFT_494247 [Schizophyllum amplum]|uniref:Secreted protein n=1 Tax=Schizophyllum amplum TaxID=97359 RepID=A0A550CF37_9AGAR|nr:hypothetical protein BD626DRAFT_494247 [Auriculariopsis ampla]
MLCMFVFILWLIHSGSHSAKDADSTWKRWTYLSPRSPSMITLQPIARVAGDDALEARSLAPPCSTTRISRWGRPLRCCPQRPPLFSLIVDTGCSAADASCISSGTYSPSRSRH